ncbi:hypothetical protein SRB5_63960 [Streptomyces sp. RB5]|uniref:PH domain-containing protein n=1 Tax=Streptomyces smaragdinus TaxID=2585196 RepID=A0A7K0CRZ7_9ACTN|nr:hypothetical protein [Streptomyces smaragdinus]MQY16200.1 hypothetical protein [Streptomyces smaragdinus]
MPLSFQTADRDFDELAGDGPLPYADHDYWRRPYRPGPWRVGGAALELLIVSYLLLATVIMMMAGSAGGAVVCFSAAVLVTAAALRMLRMGVWVSAHGLRLVGFLYTRTAPWHTVEAVRTAQQPVRWLGLPRTVQGQAVVVQLRGGEVRQLLTDRNADFLARPEAFERAADTVEAWGAELI